MHFGVSHSLLHVFIKIWPESSILFENRCSPRTTESTLALPRLKDSLPEYEEQRLCLPLDSKPDEYSETTEMGIPILSQNRL